MRKSTDSFEYKLRQAVRRGRHTRRIGALCAALATLGAVYALGDPENRCRALGVLVSVDSNSAVTLEFAGARCEHNTGGGK